MSVPDRAYTTLLTHLHRSRTTLPLQTLQASVTYYLSQTPPSVPTPTPLAASVIASPLFQSFSHSKLLALLTAFRGAVHAKVTQLKDEDGTILGRNIESKLGLWIKDVLKGLQGGGQAQAILRLNCAGGLLLGLSEVHGTGSIGEVGSKKRIEDEVIVALAEVMEVYAYTREPDAWEREFKTETEEREVDALSLALVSSSQFILLIPDHKLKVLPLPTLARYLTNTILPAFEPLTTLNPYSQSINSRSLYIPLFTSLPQVSKFLAHTITLMVDSALSSPVKVKARERKIGETWDTIRDVLCSFEGLARDVEVAWAKSALADEKETEATSDPSEKDYRTRLWQMLKTTLFTTLMVQQAVLSSLLFLPPSSAAFSSISPNSDRLPSSPQSPAAAALIVLTTLSHLSFVISQFGGISTQREGGFRELKKVVYMAVDILSKDGEASAQFVLESVRSKSVSAVLTSHSVRAARKVFTMGCLEQLVPVLSEECLENEVFAYCSPHLSDTTNRELYESAHSVVLAILSAASASASRPQSVDFQINVDAKGKTKEKQPIFAERLVPWYIMCLLENSHGGQLNIAQLRVAFSTVAQCAATASSEELLAYCVHMLTDTIQRLLPSSPDLNSPDSMHSARSGGLQEDVENESGRFHRLVLALISVLPALPLSLLLRCLEDVKNVTLKAYLFDRNSLPSAAIPASSTDRPSSSTPSSPSSSRSRDIAENLFTEMLERFGDLEKELAMKWWAANRDAFTRVGSPRMKNRDQSREDVADGMSARL